MQKKSVLISASAILFLSLLFMCTPQVDDPDNNNSSDSSSSASAGGSSSSASSGSSSSASSGSSVASSAGTSSVGDSTNFADAILISTDGTHYLASLTTADQDYYKFNGITGTTYIIQTFSEVDDVDTYMYLYNSAQTLLNENDDHGAIVQSIIILECTSTETYYIMVKGFDTAVTGNYAVSVDNYDKETYLKSVTVAPGSLTAPGTVTVSLDINRPSGATFNFVNAYLSSPNEYLNANGQHYFLIFTYSSTSRLWEAQCDFNIYNQSGVWAVYDIIYDTSTGNYEYLYYNSESSTYYYDYNINSLSTVAVGKTTVTTSTPDNENPLLTSVSATPTSIDSTGTVNVSIGASDALSGISSVFVELFNYGNYEQIDLIYNSSSLKWEGLVDFAPLLTGIWYIDYIIIYDIAQNRSYYMYNPDESTAFYCNEDGLFLTVTTIPLVTITKTGSVSSAVKNLLTDKTSKLLQDKRLQIRHNTKKSRNK